MYDYKNEIYDEVQAENLIATKKMKLRIKHHDEVF